MSFPEYPAYRDGGANWLGRVPEHWTHTRVGACFDERREKVSDRDYEPLSVTKDGVVPQLETAAKTDDGDNRKKVLIGDFVINSRSDRKGSAGLAPRNGSVSLICTVLTPRASVFRRFAHFLLRSVPFQEEYYRVGKGIVADLWSTNYGEMRGICLALPSLLEQRQIAAFLDRETAKIDALVAEQRRLMELLKGKRQAVITQAVTKGLNPDVLMKDSGVQWLGDVPAHWRVGKCGFYLSILSGFAFPSAGFSQSSDDTRLLRGINVGVGDLRWDETVYWRRIADDGLGEYELAMGDLVIGMDRPLIREGVRIAKVRAEDIPCLLLQRVARLKPTDLLNEGYLFSLLSSEMFVAHFSPETTGVSVPHISPEQIYNFVIPIPPIAEQQSIANLIAVETSKIDCLIEDAQKAIDLLNERRSALIAAAISGQIDVRGLVDQEAA